MAETATLELSKEQLEFIQEAVERSLDAADSMDVVWPEYQRSLQHSVVDALKEVTDNG